MYRSWKGELPLYLASSVIVQDEPNRSGQSFTAQACQGGWVLASFFLRGYGPRQNAKKGHPYPFADCAFI